MHQKSLTKFRQPRDKQIMSKFVNKHSAMGRENSQEMMDDLRGVVHQVRACRRLLAAVGFEMFAPTRGISCRELRNEARG